MSANSNKTLQGTLSEVSITGFRSLESVNNLKLPRLAVLIGANGAGKSNLIRFFEMLSWCLRGRNLQEFVINHGGGDDQLHFGAKTTPHMSGHLKIDTSAGMNEYRFKLAHVAPDTLAFIEETFRYSAHSIDGENQWHQLPMPAKESALADHAADTAERSYRTAQIIGRLLKSCSTYQFHDTSMKASINMRWDADEANRLRSDGGNLSAILLRLQQEWPKRYRMITRQIARVLPTFHDFELEPVAGKVQLRWRARGYEKTFGPHLTSDGSLRLFCLFTLLNLPPELLPDIVMIDEPELGLHPHAIALTGNMIKSMAAQRQVMIATQSPLLVDVFDLDNIIVARAHEGKTRLEPMEKSQYQDWLDTDFRISELWLKEPVDGPYE